MAVRPVRMFAAIGEDALGAVEALALEPGLRLVATPRTADVLLVAGPQRPSDRMSLAAVHDQLPRPRGTLWWRSEPLPGFELGVPIPDDPGEAARSIVAFGEARNADFPASERDLLDDRPPNPWEGRGEHGQGGQGMMGGTPYGRPMAMTADDPRDGLALDAYTATFGPCMAAFPPGLALQVTLQGDVIQSAEPIAAPHRQDALARAPHLALARVLRLLELHALAERLVRAGLSRPAQGAPGLARAVRWSGVLAAIPPGLARTQDGTDVRERVRLLVDGVAGERREALAGPIDLPALLAGLEWNEAILALASFDIDKLRQACLPDVAANAGRAA